MKRIDCKILNFILSIVLLLGSVACTNPAGPDTPGDSAIVTNVQAEASMLLTPESDYRIMATGAEQSDIIIMAGSKTFECAITRLSGTWFRFAVPKDITAGKYTLSIRRGERVQELFTTNVTVQSVSLRVESKTGYNIKGMVYCGTKGVKDVLVTDGVEITKTDANGHYWIKSNKTYEVVYVILPSGYNVPTQAAMPKFWAQTSTDVKSEEQHNFEIVQASNDNHTVLVVTDIHLTNRELYPNDRIQFREGFVKELIANYTGKQNVYCFNLGDFAHDVHWYRNDMGWAESLNNHPSDDISGLPCQFWSTMGNHDNDGRTPAGEDVDLRASGPYRKMVGPTHIAMNIGKVHYMLLDDILYLNHFTEPNSDPLMGDCNYNAGFRPDMLTWIERDLSYVDKNTPIVVGLHIPLVNWNGTSRNYEFNVSSNWTAFMNLFKDFKEVNFITGHTHQTRFRTVPGYGTNMYEHNIGAGSGVWWNTSQRSGGSKGANGKPGALNLCADGTPVCYYVYETSGTTRQWYYKYVGEPASKQFKSYDMNEVKKFYTSYAPANRFITDGKYTNTANGGNTTVTVKPKEYGLEEAQNTVWLNVWGYENGPFKDYGNWEITVTENGQQLPVEQLQGGYRDPLSVLCGEIYEYGQSSTFSNNSCSSTNHNHIFRVVAKDAKSTLTIKVKDRFGKVYQETMERPKKFYDGSKIENTWTLD